MLKYFKYMSYLVRHKWYVTVECFKVGLIWQGLVHDMSKLLPSEFFPYMNYFYGKKGSDIKKGRNSTGYYKPYKTGDEAFDFSWLLHQKRNKHHWQWWILPKDDGGVVIFDMPEKYVREMVCDWRGAGRAQGHGDDVIPWYEENKDKMKLSEKTRAMVEEILDF